MNAKMRGMEFSRQTPSPDPTLAETGHPNHTKIRHRLPLGG
ncbi:MAG: hypothetical protein AVDCRST_MAG59-2194 [uncultured Thermomicrobiales bacterium]|uniref:Uncharacterized protein n=1 Tax=uncultured Thermomicrobiales bacterium TaxID=1645740 RepID=A0A6J4UPS4_9BACT|nr:MAG: hypothetical protein AVDCRST_MAG59-2194 [uncultured Thermomicrobiales bacterium]